MSTAERLRRKIELKKAHKVQVVVKAFAFLQRVSIATEKLYMSLVTNPKNLEKCIGTACLGYYVIITNMYGIRDYISEGVIVVIRDYLLDVIVNCKLFEWYRHRGYVPEII